MKVELYHLDMYLVLLCAIFWGKVISGAFKAVSKLILHNTTFTWKMGDNVFRKRQINSYEK